MGSATRETMKSAEDTISSPGFAVSVEFAEGLFSVSDALATVPQLRALLADQSTAVDERVTLTRKIFAEKVPDSTVAFVSDLVAGRWSSPRELTRGIDHLGIAALAVVAREQKTLRQLVSELFTASQIFDGNRELQLALPAWGAGTEVATLIDSIFAAKVLPETLAMIHHAVLHHRGGLVAGALVRYASVASQIEGRGLATVTTAVALSEREQARIIVGLEKQFSKSLNAGFVVDSAVLGGVRAEVGSELIDATTKTRLGELRASLVR